MVCEPKRSQFHVRDSLIGAGVMIGATAVFASAGLVLRRSGWPMTGEILRSLAFSAPLMLSMPFWVLKGQPWRLQLALVGGTLAFLAAASSVAALI